MEGDYLAAMAKPTAKVELESGTSIRITFPPGTKANLRSSIPVDELLKALQVSEGEVEGQSTSDNNCIPGMPD
jgi:hypothetical protein